MTLCATKSVTFLLLRKGKIMQERFQRSWDFLFLCQTQVRRGRGMENYPFYCHVIKLTFACSLNFEWEKMKYFCHFKWAKFQTSINYFQISSSSFFRAWAHLKNRFYKTIFNYNFFWSIDPPTFFINLFLLKFGLNGFFCALVISLSFQLISFIKPSFFVYVLSTLWQEN